MKEYVWYHFILGCLRLLAVVPLPILYMLSNVIYLILYYIVRYRRSTVAANLRNSFPLKTQTELKDIEQRFYRHLCDCFVETVKLLHISDIEIDERIRVENTQLVDELISGGSSIILYLGHYGNWEWVQAISRHCRNLPLGGQIYKPMRDKVMDKIMLRIRSRFGLVSIPQKKAYRTLLEYKMQDKRFMVGFISDQRPNGGMQHWTTFLNQDAPYVTGGEDIGKRVNAGFLYLDVEKTGRGRYTMRFKPMCPTEEEKKERYPYSLCFMRMLEDTINREPAYWLWSHKRWKVRRITDGNNYVKTE